MSDRATAVWESILKRDHVSMETISFHNGAAVPASPSVPSFPLAACTFKKFTMSLHLKNALHLKPPTSADCDQAHITEK